MEKFKDEMWEENKVLRDQIVAQYDKEIKTKLNEVLKDEKTKKQMDRLEQHIQDDPVNKVYYNNFIGLNTNKDKKLVAILQTVAKICIANMRSSQSFWMSEYKDILTNAYYKNVKNQWTDWIVWPNTLTVFIDIYKIWEEWNKNTDRFDSSKLSELIWIIYARCWWPDIEDDEVVNDDVIETINWHTINFGATDWKWNTISNANLKYKKSDWSYSDDLSQSIVYGDVKNQYIKAIDEKWNELKVKFTSWYYSWFEITKNVDSKKYNINCDQDSDYSDNYTLNIKRTESSEVIITEPKFSITDKYINSLVYETIWTIDNFDKVDQTKKVKFSIDWTTWTE